MIVTLYNHLFFLIMIPSTKIFQTILEFGKAAILELPKNHTKEEFEVTMKIVVLAWNVVVMDKKETSLRLSLCHF